MSNKELQIKFRDIYVSNAMNIMKCLEDLSELKEEYESSEIYKKTGIGIYEMFNYYVKNDLFFEKLMKDIKDFFANFDFNNLINIDKVEIESLLNQLQPEHQELLQNIITELL